MITTDYYMKARELAGKAKISVAELCRRAGVSRATVSKWKGGKSQPSMRIWEKLLAAGGKK